MGSDSSILQATKLKSQNPAAPFPESIRRRKVKPGHQRHLIAREVSARSLIWATLQEISDKIQREKFKPAVVRPATRVVSALQMSEFWTSNPDTIHTLHCTCRQTVQKKTRREQIIYSRASQEMKKICLIRQIELR